MFSRLFCLILVCLSREERLTKLCTSRVPCTRPHHALVLSLLPADILPQVHGLDISIGRFSFVTVLSGLQVADYSLSFLAVMGFLACTHCAPNRPISALIFETPRYTISPAKRSQGHLIALKIIGSCKNISHM